MASQVIEVWFETTDVRLVSKLFESNAWQQLTYISPNLNELRILNRRVSETGTVSKHPSYRTSNNTASNIPPSKDLSSILSESIELVTPVLDYVPNVMVTLGKHGVLMCRNTEEHDSLFPVKGLAQEVGESMSFTHYPVRKAGQGLASIVSVSGAGDCLVAGMIMNILQHQKPHHCITAGLLAAQMSLKSHMAVPVTVIPEALTKPLVGKWVDMYCTPRQLD